MGVTVGVNNLSVVHKGSGGVSTAPLDACILQKGPVVLVLPLPNIAKSADLQRGTKKVTCDGQMVAIDGCVITPTTGDEAGDKGVMSAKIKGDAEFVSFALDVKFEGKAVARAMDKMIHNNKNTMTAPILQGPVVVPPGSEEEEGPCAFCTKKHKKKSSG